MRPANVNLKNQQRCVWNSVVTSFHCNKVKKLVNYRKITSFETISKKSVELNVANRQPDADNLSTNCEHILLKQHCYKTLLLRVGWCAFSPV